MTGCEVQSNINALMQKETVLLSILYVQAPSIYSNGYFKTENSVLFSNLGKITKFCVTFRISRLLKYRVCSRLVIMHHYMHMVGIKVFKKKKIKVKCKMMYSTCGIVLK